MKKYFHTKINKYQDILDKKNVEVREDNGSDREDEFNRIKADIEAEFKYKGGPFLLVEIENRKNYKKERRVCANMVQVSYRHAGYGSGIMLEVFDVFRKKWVDVTTNCRPIKAYESGVTFKTIIEDIL